MVKNVRAYQQVLIIHGYLASLNRRADLIKISKHTPSSCQERIMNVPIRVVHSDKELEILEVLRTIFEFGTLCGKIIKIDGPEQGRL